MPPPWKPRVTVAAVVERAGAPVSYVRFAFTGELGETEAGRALDDGILRVLWLTADELRARRAQHRSPLVMKCVDDYLAGRRFPLDLVYTHASALEA